MEKKRCKVVMLPTTEKSRLFKGGGSLNYLPHSVDNGDGWRSPQHLYIISDDKIEEGDWVIETSNSNALEQFADYSLNQKSMGCKKIIATTDSKLKLPQIPQSFIEEYCRKGGIDEVDVEYEVTPSLKTGDNYNIGGEVREVTDVWLGTNNAWYVSTPNNHAWSCPIELKPKVNSDNTINIHLIEEKMYTREEVEAIAAKFLLLGFGKSAEGRNAEILCESRWLEEMFPEHFESIEIFTKDNL